VLERGTANECRLRLERETWAGAMESNPLRGCFQFDDVLMRPGRHAIDTVSRPYNFTHTVNTKHAYTRRTDIPGVDRRCDCESMAAD